MKSDQDTTAGLRTDWDRLQAYAAQDDESAFAEIVVSHLDLVYSTALRRLNGDVQGAKDVAQQVFCDLARTGSSLPEGSVIAGWLYRHASFLAANAQRGDRRRQLREHQALAMHDLLTNESSLWPRVAPVLDEALASLSATDRDLVVLRFLEGKTLKEVGHSAGLSEDAARMRVNRSLDKLRDLLTQHGIQTTSAALAAVLPVHALTTAPLGFSELVIGTALGTATTTVSTLGTVTNVIKIMASTKLKLTVATILLAGVAIPVVIQSRHLRQLDQENRSLRAQIEQQANTANQAVSVSQGTRDDADVRELVRLRAEVAQLRSAAQVPRSVPTPKVVLRPAPRANQPPADRIFGHDLFDGLLLSEEHVTAVKTMKQAAMDLRLVLSRTKLPEGTAPALSDPGAETGQDWKKLTQMPDEQWDRLEVLVPNIATFAKLEADDPGAIVARAKDGFQTPDGRWVRVYARADGSVVNLIHDTKDDVLTPTYGP
ncbi:MAG TPA: sigma-70 family RNA polymerase sigma factor [Candidatus Limnocylindria bacterium]|jgi:RNA polymerase sigma factor (sigma-70 family)|nr:sigma-70 family RNA polymerase sigma factor [Candidatus Limnocylindria bacterium]